MALPAGLQTYVRTDGNDANGGGFNPARGGTNWANQASPQVVLDGGTIYGDSGLTNSLLIFGVSVTNDWKGNVLNITGCTGGTITNGRYEITAVNTGTGEITLDRDHGDGSALGVSGNIGGAYLSASIAAEDSPAGTSTNRSKIHVKSGTYTVSSTSFGVANGRIRLKSYTSMLGFQTTPEDALARPVFQASGISSTTIITPNTSDSMYCHSIEVDGANLTSVVGFGMGNHAGTYESCKAYRCNPGFSHSSQRYNVISCIAESCTVGFNQSGGCVASYCLAISCTTGFGPSSGQGTNIFCIAKGCTWGYINHEGLRLNCIAYDSGAGQSMGFDKNGLIVNSIVYRSAGGAAISQGSFGLNINNASQSSTAPTTSIRRNHVVLTEDPFVDAANNDFRLNHKPGGGGLLRRAGFQSWPGWNFSGRPDIGMVQDASGGMVITPARRIR